MAYEMASFLIFIALLALIIFKDRKKIKLQGILLIRRTQRSRKLIDSIATKYNKILNPLFSIGTVVAVFTMIFVVYVLLENAIKIIVGVSKAPGAGFLLPAPISQPVALPGVFFIPWWIWVLGIGSVIIPHEFAHGIAFRLHKIRIKSVGWILLLILPGAFVEPDEKQLKAAPSKVKLKAYAAGSFANLTMAFIFWIVLMMMVSPVPVGMAYSIINDTPADYANLSGSIRSINGEPIISQDDLIKKLAEKSPGEVINIETSKNVAILPRFRFLSLSPEPVAITTDETRSYQIKLTSRDNDTTKGFLGISDPIASVKGTAEVSIIYMVILWFLIFNFSIGIINLLPLKPLDGGLFFEELIQRFNFNSKTVVKVVSLSMLVLLMFNIIGPIIL